MLKYRLIGGLHSLGRDPVDKHMVASQASLVSPVSSVAEAGILIPDIKVTSSSCLALIATSSLDINLSKRLRVRHSKLAGDFAIDV